MTTNAYGLMNLWAQGDWIIRTVALFLLAMSVTSWSVIILKSLQLNRIKAQAQVADKMLAPDAVWCIPATQGQGALNPFHRLIRDGLSAASAHRLHRNRLDAAINHGEWIGMALRQSFEKVSQTFQADLPILASIGSTSPFVGLFGTVWGIYHALIAIGTSGQSGIDQIAGPVGEALIMTAFGLAVAIPAVLGYNFLLQGQKKIFAQLRHFAHELQIHLLMGLGRPEEMDAPEYPESLTMKERAGV